MGSRRKKKSQKPSRNEGISHPVPSSEGLKAKVEDAEFLWHLGRIESAWTLGLIAVAATARKRYPVPGDAVCYKSFINDIAMTVMTGTLQPASPVQIHFGDPGDSIGLGELIYHELRCTLLHEAEMPIKVKFSKSNIVDGRHVANLRSANPSSPDIFLIPDFFVLNLLLAVRHAPENSGIF